MTSSFSIVALVDTYSAINNHSVVIRPKFGAGVITLNFDNRRAIIDFCMTLSNEVMALEEAPVDCPLVPAQHGNRAAAAIVQQESHEHSKATVGVLREEDKPDALTLEEHGRDIFDIAHDEMLAARTASMSIKPKVHTDSDGSFESDYGVSQELW